ncbi:hypothetical protein HGRIS_005487 [Hohenbuehelia grisea]|uniref:Uncharacterized protein n=1 Tax=Hohenbuehelia grisea TaxID=104357 RepID=A0ABR3JXV3_9AGAR
MSQARAVLSHWTKVPCAFRTLSTHRHLFAPSPAAWVIRIVPSYSLLRVVIDTSPSLRESLAHSKSLSLPHGKISILISLHSIAGSIPSPILIHSIFPIL